MKIVKLGYSVNPWRLVSDDGKEFYRSLVHKEKVVGSESFSAPTKSAMIEKVLLLAEELRNEVSRLRQLGVDARSELA